NWVNKLGNLVLLTGPKNSKAANKDFKTKIDTYFGGQQGAPFQLTVSAVREQQWTVEVVQKRQQLFIKKLAAIWQL
ncbi:MAG TPA: HNH endonuclease family protein, partial [Ktedonobacterales bacterium]|nr:HNH endonuclease family protein [Ktedonobacterales bacterium]